MAFKANQLALPQFFIVFPWQGLSAIVVLGEMDDAPWWKLAGYTFCILMMMAGCPSDVLIMWK
jgi:hypothetical protein